jgi:predicted dehydrogenase
MPPLRVAVVGTGAFGRNHLRVYRELQTAHPDLVQLTALVEPDESRRNEFAAHYGIPAFASVNEMLGAPPLALSLSKGLNSETWVNAASICVPTIHHAAVAEQLLHAGVDILIEKPLAASLAEADHLLSIANERNRILAVGHLERFNPAVTAALAALNRPMFFEAHRLSIFTPRSLDVDVVLDLMIHDLDIVLALAQSAVREVRAVGLPILSRKTDIANVRLEFESGCVANFTASRVSTEQVRKLRLFQPHQYLSLDFARQELLSIDVDPRLIAAMAAGTPLPAAFPTAAGAPSTAEPEHAANGSAAAQAALTHPTAGFSLTKSGVPKGEPLRLELENFLNSVRHRTPPRVHGEAGRAALALALEINRHIADHAQRAGLA